MDDRPKKPVHTRDHRGRHKVDLRQLPAPVRYGIAIAVVVFVLGLAVWFGPDRGFTDEVVAPFIPYVGAAVIIVVVLAVWLQIKGRK